MSWLTILKTYSRNSKNHHNNGHNLSRLNGTFVCTEKWHKYGRP